MKKYEFVQIKLQNNYVANAVMSEHRQIIEEWTDKGYRYVGFIPTKQGPSGKIMEAESIFESLS